MTIHQFTKALILSFCLSSLAVAGETNTVPPDIDSTVTDTDFTLCGAKKSSKAMELASKPKPTNTEGISYVSGGICSEEVNFMKDIANRFPLEVVLVQQEQGREVYLADVTVSLQDAKQQEVLQVLTDGPFLFVNLPNGKYTINASYRGVKKTQQVTITKKHSRVVFVWEEGLGQRPPVSE